MNPMMMLAAAAVFTTAIGLLRLLGARLLVSAAGGVGAVLATGVIAALLI